MKIQKFIFNIEKLCAKVLNGLLIEPRNVQAITFYFIKILKAYNVYNLIHKQLTSNKLVIITQRDIDDNLNLVIKENIEWFKAIINYRLPVPTYGPIPPAGPSSGGPGAGAPGPGTGGPGTPGPSTGGPGGPGAVGPGIGVPTADMGTQSTGNEMGSQTVEPADMGTQSTFTRRPMQMQTGASRISIDPVEGAERIEPSVIGPRSSEPSAPSRSPTAFPIDTPQTDDDETPREKLREQRDKHLTDMLTAEFDKMAMEDQIATLEHQHETNSMASEDRFGKIFRAINVPRPTAVLAAPTEEEQQSAASAGESDDSGLLPQGTVERAVVIANEVEPAVRQWQDAIVLMIQRALNAARDETIEIMRGVRRNGIRISRELAEEIVRNPDILTGAMLFMLYGALTTPMYERLMPIIEHHDVVDLGEPSFSEDYMGQLPPRFFHESWVDQDMKNARDAYLMMRPFVLFMRGGATVVVARAFRNFMNVFGEMMRNIAEMAPERWARVDVEIRQVIHPLQLLPLPDGRPVLQPFQAFEGRAHQLPGQRALPNIPAAAKAVAKAAVRAPPPAAAAAAAAASSSSSAAQPAVAKAPPAVGLNAAPPLPMPAPRVIVPRPGERPPPGEVLARAKSAPQGPTHSSRAGVPPQLQAQPKDPPPWMQRPGSRPPQGGNKPMRKELIHVPKHVLEYFDVGNDPYFINSVKPPDFVPKI